MKRHHATIAAVSLVGITAAGAPAAVALVGITAAAPPAAGAAAKPSIRAYSDI
jgi:hypothetical protein